MINYNNWDRQLEQRKEEILLLKNTLSYIPKNDISIEKSYLIHDNGGRPFKVTAKNGTISIGKHHKRDKYEEFMIINEYTRII